MMDVWLKSSEGQLSLLGIMMTACLLLFGAAWWVDVLASFRAHMGLAMVLGMVLGVVHNNNK